MLLGTEVGFGPGHIVLDGDPALSTPEKGPCLLWQNGRPSQLLLSTCYYCATLCYGPVFARLSVCLSYAGIVSKLLNAPSNNNVVYSVDLGLQSSEVLTKIQGHTSGAP